LTSQNATIDPGHGWLQVPMALLERLNIVDKISEFSYKCAGYAFLEEDCDWTVFSQAMEKKGLQYSVEPQILDTESVIRKYDRFEKK